MEIAIITQLFCEFINQTGWKWKILINSQCKLIGHLIPDGHAFDYVIGIALLSSFPFPQVHPNQLTGARTTEISI